MRRLICLIALLSVLSVHAQSYYLLVGTYTNMGSNSSTPPKDSTGSKGIYVYRWDAATGQATLLSHTAGVVNPSFLDPAPDGVHVYAATETRTTGAGSLSAFLLDRGSGTLRFINKVPSGGDNPVYVSVHRSGRWVALANYTGGSLSVFPIRADGTLLPYVQNIQHTGHSVNPTRQEKSHVHSVVFSPDNRTLYAQDLGKTRSAYMNLIRWSGSRYAKQMPGDRQGRLKSPQLPAAVPATSPFTQTASMPT